MFGVLARKLAREGHSLEATDGGTLARPEIAG
jgi:hypothetical protein